MCFPYLYGKIEFMNDLNIYIKKGSSKLNPSSLFLYKELIKTLPIKLLLRERPLLQVLHPLRLHLLQEQDFQVPSHEALSNVLALRELH